MYGAKSLFPNESGESLQEYLPSGRCGGKQRSAQMVNCSVWVI